MTTGRGKGPGARKRKTEVPGQALGIGLQYTRLLQLLLEAPQGSACSMEYLDDVALEYSHGVRLGQSKSALTANPVADRAKSLWKTLSNWVTLATEGGCDPARTTFEIYVSRAVSGQLVDAFSSCSDLPSAQSAVQTARELLWGMAPNFPKRSEVAAEISPYVENVFSADPGLVLHVIKNFRLTCGSGSPQSDVEAILKKHPISQSRIRDIADHLSGVVKRRVDELLEAGEPAIISSDEFHTWYTAYVQKVDRDLVLRTHAKRPSDREAEGYLPRVFVQQLDLIGLPFEDKLEAVGDYLMAAADRTEWAASGDVDATSFEELDTSLRRMWKHKKMACTVAHRSKSFDEQGLALYAECMTVDMRVQQKEAPDHFLPGCLHHLADELFIGWHPEFAGKLRPKKAA